MTWGRLHIDKGVMPDKDMAVKNYMPNELFSYKNGRRHVYVSGVNSLTELEAIVGGSENLDAIRKLAKEIETQTNQGIILGTYEKIEKLVEEIKSIEGLFNRVVGISNYVLSMETEAIVQSRARGRSQGEINKMLESIGE